MEVPRGFNIQVGEDGCKVVYSIRMHDELLATLSKVLLVNGKEWPITRVHEVQPVDVACQTNFEGQPRMRIMGSVREKLLVKPELVQSKMEEVRKQSETAEKARHSRRTISLDEGPPMVKRRILTAPLARLNSMAVRPTPSMISKSMGSNRSFPAITKPASDIESQDSWSLQDPVTNEASLGTIGKLKKATLESDIPSRKSATGALLPSIPKNSTKDIYHQLEEEFSRRYQEYLFLDSWIEQRLVIFTQLKDQLSSNSQGHAQLIFRLIVEEQRLKEDQIYKEKLEKLEETYAALIMIKARFKELVAMK